AVPHDLRGATVPPPRPAAPDRPRLPRLVGVAGALTFPSPSCAARSRRKRRVRSPPTAFSDGGARRVYRSSASPRRKDVAALGPQTLGSNPLTSPSISEQGR